MVEERSFSQQDKVKPDAERSPEEVAAEPNRVP
jgi:hypothetical protein